MDLHVIGAGFGDEGKGHVVNYFGSQFDDCCVLRTTGAHQAAHNVIENGKHHTFSQFGSGTFHSRPCYYLAPVCDPLAALKEAKHLKNIGIKDPYELLFFSNDCLISAPYHQILNKVTESLLDSKKYGSCGVGVWETINDYRTNNAYIKISDLFEDFTEFVKSLAWFRKFKTRQFEELNYTPQNSFTNYELLYSDEFFAFIINKYKEFRDKFQVNNRDDLLATSQTYDNRIFESAQGLLLDPNIGHEPPYVTPLSPLDVFCCFDKEPVHTFLVSRTYLIRHGSGPFKTEEVSETIRNRFIKTPDKHNSFNLWQDNLRYGAFDIPLVKERTNYFKQLLTSKDKLELFITHEDVYKDGFIFTGNGSYFYSPCLSNSLSDLLEIPLAYVSCGDTRKQIRGV